MYCYWARLTMYQIDKVQMYLMVILQGKQNMNIYSKTTFRFSSTLDKTGPYDGPADHLRC